MRNVLFLFFISGMIFSCSDLKKETQILSIDQLSKTVDSLQEIILKSEIDSLPHRRIATQDVELRIKQNFYSDTIQLVLGKKMDAYKVMRRKLEPLGNTYHSLKLGVEDELVTLRNLKVDIQSGSGKRNKYEEYIRFEKSKVEQITVLLQDYLKEKESTLKTYNKLHPELLAFSFELIKD